MHTGGTPQIPTWAWVAFGAVALGLLLLDLWAVRGERAESRRVTLAWTVAWIGTGLAFGGLVWAVLGYPAAEEYYAAYAIEKGLSLDNLFLFYVVFRSLGVRGAAQHKVLFWGILGAVAFRGAFIFVGVAALERWAWVSWLFGAVLLGAAWQALRHDPSARGESRVVAWLSTHLPVSREDRNGRFLAREGGRRVATPLLLALIAIEVSDVIMAVDSVPAALSITHDRFVVYTSNVFALMGLRALYLYLANVLTELKYLHYGLAAVLAFAGVKIVTDEWLHIPALVAIGVVVVLIGGSVWGSLAAQKREEAHAT